MKSQTPAQKKITAEELNLIAQFLDKSEAVQLRSDVQENLKSVSQKEILEARADLREDPLSIAKMNHLRGLELQAGQHTMAAYLETRINEAKKGRL